MHNAIASVKTLRKRAQRLCRIFGIKNRSNEKPGAHLGFNDPTLQKLRLFIQNAAKEKKCHSQLICNFDQVWSTLFRPEKSTLMKPANLRGLQQDPIAKSLMMRKLRHGLERALDLPLTEVDPSAHAKQTEARIPQVQGGEAASCTVDAWRQPRSLTTLSWIDGHVSRGYLTFREGGISQATRDLVNERYGQFIHVGQPQPSSHVWSESTLIHYLSFLAGEIRVRRQMLQLDASHRCLVMMDQAGAHMSRTYLSIQEKWCEQHNVESRRGIGSGLIYTHIHA